MLNFIYQHRAILAILVSAITINCLIGYIVHNLCIRYRKAKAEKERNAAILEEINRRNTAQFVSETLSPEEVVLMQHATCPTCKTVDKFMEGPAAGPCTNIMCSVCNNWYHVGMMPGFGIFHAERICHGN